MLGNKEIMARNIKKYMQRKNVDRAQLCKDLDIKYSTFSEWVQGNAYPRIDKIEMLANYFGCSKADLVEDISADHNVNLDGLSYVVESYKTMDDRQRNLLKAYIELLKGGK